MVIAQEAIRKKKNKKEEGRAHNSIKQINQAVIAFGKLNW